MNKMNLTIAIGLLCCATFVGAIVGIPLMIYGMWGEYVDHTNKKGGRNGNRS